MAERTASKVSTNCARVHSWWITSALMLAASALPAAETAITIRSDAGASIGVCELGATLDRPDNARAMVVFVAGSGTTDRDEAVSQLGIAPFRDLASALAARSVASLRYDKRGFSAACRPGERAERELRPDHYMVDIAAAVRRARAAAPDLPLFVLAHSEGVDLTLALVAEGRIEPQGLVLIAGMGEAVDELLLSQLRRMDESLSEPKRSEFARFIDDSASYFAAVRAGQARPDAYWPADPRFASWGRAYTGYWQGAIAVSEAASRNAALVGAPSLLIQGDRDQNVGRGDFDALASGLAAHGGRAVYLPELDHFLTKPGETSVDSGAAGLIADWILDHAPAQPPARPPLGLEGAFPPLRAPAFR